MAASDAVDKCLCESDLPDSPLQGQMLSLATPVRADSPPTWWRGCDIAVERKWAAAEENAQPACSVMCAPRNGDSAAENKMSEHLCKAEKVTSKNGDGQGMDLQDQKLRLDEDAIHDNKAAVVSSGTLGRPWGQSRYSTRLRSRLINLSSQN